MKNAILSKNVAGIANKAAMEITNTLAGYNLQINSQGQGRIERTLYNMLMDYSSLVMGPVLSELANDLRKEIKNENQN